MITNRTLIVGQMPLKWMKIDEVLYKRTEDYREINLLPGVILDARFNIFCFSF